MKRALGVCYYPEHWPEEMWKTDAAQMVAAGITWVRIGEFAWSRLEPQQGTYDFDWLDRAVEVLARAGLRIIMGTPSATPPRWMLDRFPDMLAHDLDGAVRGFGSRRHYCHSHAGYRDAAAGMTARMGARYGAHPAIGAWQIDNEYGCHETVISTSDAALTAFRDWLADRYGTVEALNAAWGNVFWSMEYADLRDIGLPFGTVTQPNPAHELAFRRFSSDQVVAWNAAQVAALRPHTDAPLLHNYMGRVLEFDHFELGADLDIATWDSYPIGFLSDRLEGSAAHKARYLRQGDPDMQAFHHDLYRAVGTDARWWVMEQQPGPVNWAPYNPAPLPGMVRLWTWEAFAHGAEVVSYFRWRQAPFAQEQMHAGLRRPDNSAAEGLAEASAVAAELAEMPDVALHQAPVALVFDYGSDWAWRTLPQGQSFDYFALVFDAYRALRRQGLSVDILPPRGADLRGYKLVLAPGLAQIEDALATAMAAHDGICLVGPRANLITPELSLRVPLGPALPDLDATVTRVESMPPQTRVPTKGAGDVIHWMEDMQGTAPVSLHATDGRAVIVGDGPLRYLAGWPDATLWDQIIGQLAQEVELPLTPMPEGLRIRDTGTHRFCFNYAPEAIDWMGQTIPAAGVVWWPLADAPA